MKKFLCFLLLTCLTAVVYADIQDPPANDQGPTRKLGRGLSNLAWCWTEVPYTIACLNTSEGNAASTSYGVVRGFGRAFYRLGAGFYETVTFAAPSYKGTYRPFYQSDIPWVHGGYAEYPPELGYESKYDYCRNQNGY